MEELLKRLSNYLLGKEKYFLPKGYLSYSQMQRWLSSKESYMKEYFEDGPKLNNKYLSFGKESAESRENGNEDMIPEALRYTLREFEFDTTIQGVRVIGKLDACDESMVCFREDKTGKTPWTQKRTDSHKQFTFYAAALKSISSITPRFAHLVWLETRDVCPIIGCDTACIDEDTFWKQVNAPTVEYTGRVVCFRKDFNDQEIEQVEKLIVQVASEISESYSLFIHKKQQLCHQH